MVTFLPGLSVYPQNKEGISVKERFTRTPTFVSTAESLALDPRRDLEENTHTGKKTLSGQGFIQFTKNM